MIFRIFERVTFLEGLGDLVLEEGCLREGLGIFCFFIVKTEDLLFDIVDFLFEAISRISFSVGFLNSISFWLIDCLDRFLKMDFLEARRDFTDIRFFLLGLVFVDLFFFF